MGDRYDYHRGDRGAAVRHHREMRNLLVGLFRGSSPARHEAIDFVGDAMETDRGDWIVTSTPAYLSDEVQSALLHDPRFWAGFLNWTWEGDDERDVIERTLGAGDDAVIPWWNELSGWHQGIFDESDGDLEHPKTIRLPFHAGRQLDIEIHAGSIYYRLRSENGVEDLGVLGPHESMPGLPWHEVRTLASAAERGADTQRGPISFSAALLLMAPLARHLPEDARLDEVEGDLARAFNALEALQPGRGAALAAAWLRNSLTHQPPHG
jgi:hypothetical protein